MNKNLFFIRTNRHDMIVSVDTEKNYRYLLETNDFPNLTGDKEEQKKQPQVAALTVCRLSSPTAMSSIVGVAGTGLYVRFLS